MLSIRSLSMTATAPRVGRVPDLWPPMKQNASTLITCFRQRREEKGLSWLSLLSAKMSFLHECFNQLQIGLSIYKGFSSWEWLSFQWSFYFFSFSSCGEILNGDNACSHYGWHVWTWNNKGQKRSHSFIISLPFAHLWFRRSSSLNRACLFFSQSIASCSFNILSFKSGWRDLYVRTSTFLPSNSSSSIFNPERSSKLFLPSNSTSKSISLSSVASPLTIEPKSDALFTPYFWSTLIMIPFFLQSHSWSSPIYTV